VTSRWISDEGQRYLAAIGHSRWLARVDDKVAVACRHFALQPLHALPGGVAGAVIKCRREDQSSLVLKVQPPGAFRRQVAALVAVAGVRMPHVIDTLPSADATLLELVEGTASEGPWDVELSDVAACLSAWRDVNAGELVSAARAIPPWIDHAARAVSTPQLHQVASEGMAAVRELPVLGENFIHGDVGYHNLVHAHTGLIAVDPYGWKGHPAIDAGAAAVWCADKPADVPQAACYLADALGLEKADVLGWTGVRAAVSACSGRARGLEEQVRRCLEVRRLALELRRDMLAAA
jgi:hypothetical protein